MLRPTSTVVRSMKTSPPVDTNVKASVSAAVVMSPVMGEPETSVEPPDVPFGWSSGAMVTPLATGHDGEVVLGVCRARVITDGPLDELSAEGPPMMGPQVGAARGAGVIGGAVEAVVSQPGVTNLVARGLGPALSPLLKTNVGLSMPSLKLLRSAMPPVPSPKPSVI